MHSIKVAIKHIDSFQFCSFLSLHSGVIASSYLPSRPTLLARYTKFEKKNETFDVKPRNNLRKTYQTKQILVHKISHFSMVTQRFSQRCVTPEITAAKETSITNTAKKKHSKVKNSTHDLSLSSLWALLCVVSTWASLK